MISSMMRLGDRLLALVAPKATASAAGKGCQFRAGCGPYPGCGRICCPGSGCGPCYC